MSLCLGGEPTYKKSPAGCLEWPRELGKGLGFCLTVEVSESVVSCHMAVYSPKSPQYWSKLSFIVPPRLQDDRCVRWQGGSSSLWGPRDGLGLWRSLPTGNSLLAS